jgi:predicted DNA-binding protein
MAKKLTNFRLTPEAIELLKKLSEKTIRSQADMLEFLIKEAAKKEGIKVD